MFCSYKKEKYPYLLFVDENLGNGKFRRSILNLNKKVFVFDENSVNINNISYIEVTKEFPNLPKTSRKLALNKKIGSLDVETFIKDGSCYAFAVGVG